MGFCTLLLLPHPPSHSHCCTHTSITMPDSIQGSYGKTNYCLQWNSTGPVGWMAKFGYKDHTYAEGKARGKGKDITAGFVKNGSKDFDSAVIRSGKNDKSGASMGQYFKYFG